MLKILFLTILLIFSQQHFAFAEEKTVVDEENLRIQEEAISETKTVEEKKDENKVTTKIKTKEIKQNPTPEDIEEKIPEKVEPKYKTLMLSENEFKEITKIIKALEEGIDLSELEEAELEETTIKKDTIFDENMATVYLNSILYISENRWAVWANNVKITNENNGEGELKILSISQGKITFLWTISMTKWEVINANYTVSKNLYKVNKENQVEVKFILEPNQTFIPSLNTIVEGNVKENTMKKESEDSKEGEEESSETEEENLEFSEDDFSDLFM